VDCPNSMYCSREQFPIPFTYTRSLYYLLPVHVYSTVQYMYSAHGARADHSAVQYNMRVRVR
jgi:hypothetical protein